MFRTFGFLTMSGLAQPLLPDKLTAALAIPPNGVDPILNVANTAIYQTGDRITIDPGQTDQDTVLVGTILSPTTMQVSSQGATIHAHVVNTVIALDLCSGIILITAGSGATALWVGADDTVTDTGGGSAFLNVFATGSYNLALGAGWNVIRTTDAWIAGVGTYSVAAYVV